MPKVRANRVCFVDNGIRQEGDVFEYNGVHNACLDVLDAPKAPEPQVESDDVDEMPALVKPRLRRGRSAS